MKEIEDLHTEKEEQDDLVLKKQMFAITVESKVIGQMNVESQRSQRENTLRMM